MGYRVFKFGGSSVADAQAITHVCRIIEKNPQKLVVVVSAMGGVTDTLLTLSTQAVANARKDEERDESISFELKSGMHPHGLHQVALRTTRMPHTFADVWRRWL